MECPWCHRWNAEENVFCAWCGQRLDGAAPPPPRPRPQNPARNAIEAEKKARRERRRRGNKAQGRAVVGLHFAMTLLLLGLCLFFLWRQTDLDRIVADWMDPNRPFETFNLQETPEGFEEALGLIETSVFATTPGLVKWTEPVRLRCEGSPNLDDMVTLRRIIGDFNGVAGFPGIVLVDEGENAVIAFADTEAEYWDYTARFEGDVAEMTSYCKRLVVNGVYQRASVLITPKESSQNKRNSVIIHEMTHLTGFVGHVESKSSILYEHAVEPGLSDTDLLALEMLYDPALHLGMDYAAVAAYFEGEANLEDYLGPWQVLRAPGPPAVPRAP